MQACANVSYNEQDKTIGKDEGKWSCAWQLDKLRKNSYVNNKGLLQQGLSILSSFLVNFALSIGCTSVY